MSNQLLASKYKLFTPRDLVTTPIDGRTNLKLYPKRKIGDEPWSEMAAYYVLLFRTVKEDLNAILCVPATTHPIPKDRDFLVTKPSYNQQLYPSFILTWEQQWEHLLVILANTRSVMFQCTLQFLTVFILWELLNKYIIKMNTMGLASTSSRRMTPIMASLQYCLCSCHMMVQSTICHSLS